MGESSFVRIFAHHDVLGHLRERGQEAAIASASVGLHALVASDVITAFESLDVVKSADGEDVLRFLYKTPRSMAVMAFSHPVRDLCPDFLTIMEIMER